MNNRLLAVLVVALAVSGCGGEKAGRAGAAATKAPVEAGADAVAAVLQTTGTPIAKLGFALVTRPVKGVPSELRLDISSSAAIPALQVHAESESIAIDQATAQAMVPVEAGKTANHLVRITPQRDGLVDVTVRLRGSADGPETVYVIPVLVAATAAGG